MNRRNNAFTLIELLVVIAIIAILAAILFPVFAQAKLAAKKTADLSNMKQIGTAVQLYLVDSEDVFPLHSFGSQQTPVQYVNSYTWSSQQCIGQYTKNTELLRSPIDSFSAMGKFNNLPTDRPPKMGKLSYMPNTVTPDWSKGSLFPGQDAPRGIFVAGSFWWNTQSPTNQSMVQAPSDVIMLANGYKEYYIWFTGNSEAASCDSWNNTELDWCPSSYAIGIGCFPEDIYNMSQPITAATSARDKVLRKAWRKFNDGNNFVMSDTSAKYLQPSKLMTADNKPEPKRWLVNPQ
ncbi:MAG: prepilin-type N-terminal cleavage/methylation domain-containing protein [Armatimonadetes bacterium]|nr:prepilin-type N-terminal cleavage/methylation domain-containing protein [Armatimonadota bacterium]